VAEPEYLICLECDTPVYVFEWREGRLSEVVCPVCGNEDLASFATEDEIEEMSHAADEDEDE
jgi:uncharacterized Zn finger protein (UPF0148 family)